MRKALIFMICSLAVGKAQSQVVEVISETRAAGFAPGQNKPELFGRTLLDYGFTGQFQTSAQALKINIGEPNKFYLPLYVFVGATSGDFGKNELNKGTLASLINSNGGAINVAGNLYISLLKSQSGISSIQFTAMGGAKLVSGRDATTGSGLFKPAGYAESGLYFQTGAWEANGEYKDGGICWFQARYAALGMAQDDVKAFFGSAATGLPLGPKIDFGIFIKNKVNIKMSYYKATTSKNITGMDSSQFKIAFDYNVSK